MPCIDTSIDCRPGGEEAIDVGATHAKLFAYVLDIGFLAPDVADERFSLVKNKVSGLALISFRSLGHPMHTFDIGIVRGLVAAKVTSLPVFAAFQNREAISVSLAGACPRVTACCKTRAILIPP